MTIFAREFARSNLLAPFVAVGLGRDEMFGPENALPFGASWAVVSGAGVTVDAGGIHFANADNLATVGLANAGIDNDAVYRVQLTIANVGAPNDGTLQVLLFGTTNNHVAVTNEFALANGTYVFYVYTTLPGTATQNAIRARCTGTTGNNNFDVTALSVKRVL